MGDARVGGQSASQSDGTGESTRVIPSRSAPIENDDEVDR